MPRSLAAGSFEELRPVLEVHRVEVPPLSAPNETVSFEDVHDVEWDAISVATVFGPKPIVGELGVYVDCRAPRVRAAISSVLDSTAIECPGTRKRVFVDLWGESIEFLGHCAKLVRNTVHFRDREKTTTRFR